MKKFFLSMSLAFLVTTSFCQYNWNIDFESNNYTDRIWIDTGSNPNNIWQIGMPTKSIFNNAHSPTHAIVTDTLQSYLVNDTSSFIITHIREQPQWGANYLLLLDFYFQLNTDTINDHGIIEASIDQGNTWINLMLEDSIYQFTWIEPKPVLFGNTIGWTHFSLDLRNLTYLLGYSDTLLYRFTFVSDGIQTNKEGWMIDDYTFEDYWEKIQEIQNNDIISVFPNPTSSTLNFNRTNTNGIQIVQIINNMGKLVYDNSYFLGEPIDIHQFTNGIYLLKYSDAKYFSIMKFIVNH